MAGKQRQDSSNEEQVNKRNKQEIRETRGLRTTEEGDGQVKTRATK